MLSNIPSHYYVIGSTIMAILMGSFVMVIRMRASKKNQQMRRKLSFHLSQCLQVR